MRNDLARVKSELDTIRKACSTHEMSDPIFTQTFTVFTPAEAEWLTGVNVMLQRDWRRRGIMVKRDGHARFDLFDLADMLVIKSGSDAGLSIERAKALVPYVSAAIIQHALHVSNSMEGDYLDYMLIHGESYAENIAKMRSSEITQGDLVIWANGFPETVANAGKAIERAPPEQLFGVVRVLKLKFIGEEFARRARRALVHIEKSTT